MTLVDFVLLPANRFRWGARVYPWTYWKKRPKKKTGARRVGQNVVHQSGLAAAEKRRFTPTC